MNSAGSQRQPYLDWLRVFGTLSVFLFHCARFLDAHDWHVKSQQTSSVATGFVEFTVQWLMPLFFMVSAGSVWFALQRGSPSSFIRARLQRLGVPFVFGVFVLIPPQVYLERLSHGRFHDSFLQFLPHYFDGFYGFGGNFAWMGLHLWYLLALLLFSLITLPLLTRLRRHAESLRWARIAEFMACPVVLYSLALPVGVLELTLDPHGPGRRDFGGWNLFAYLVVFMLSCLLFAAPPALETVRRRRLNSLALALATLALLLILRPHEHTMPVVRSLMALLRAYHSWFWLLAFLGLAMHHLNSVPPWLARANEAVMPFYILHQTVIVVVGYSVLALNARVGVEFSLISSGSLVILCLLYELLIRRLRLLRLLFGMKPAPHAS